jgi:hypothetical protein
MIVVPGFTPKRIYLEKVEDTNKSKVITGNASSQPKKGFLGVKWGFDDTKK